MSPSRPLCIRGTPRQKSAPASIPRQSARFLDCVTCREISLLFFRGLRRKLIKHVRLDTRTITFSAARVTVYRAIDLCLKSKSLIVISIVLHFSARDLVSRKAYRLRNFFVNMLSYLHSQTELRFGLGLGSLTHRADLIREVREKRFDTWDVQVEKLFPPMSARPRSRTIKRTEWKYIRIDRIHSSSRRAGARSERFTQPYLSSNGYRSTSGRLKTWRGAGRNLSVFLKSIHLLFGILRCSQVEMKSEPQSEDVIFFGGRSKDKHWTSSRPQFHTANKSLSSNKCKSYTSGPVSVCVCRVDKINLEVNKNIFSFSPAALQVIIFFAAVY